MELTSDELDILRGALVAAEFEGLLGRTFSDPFNETPNREVVESLLVKVGMKWNSEHTGLELRLLKSPAVLHSPPTE